MAENVRPTGAQDAATQARSGEARVIGIDQDKSASGAAGAASGLDALRGNIADLLASGPVFTRDQ